MHLSVARKGHRSFLFLPFVCLYFDHLRRNLRGFRRCVFSGFVYSPTGRENCAVGERRSRRPSGALFWRAFPADKRRLRACFARNGRFLVSLADDTATARPKRRLMFSYANRPAPSAVCFCFGRAVLASPFALILAVQSSAFAACFYFYSWQCSPADRISAFLLACVHAEIPAGRCAPQGGLCADFCVFFARLTSYAFCAKPVLPLRRALWDVSRETLTNAALCATIETQNAGIATRNF